VSLLKKALGAVVVGRGPADPDERVWVMSYPGVRFEVSDEWGGLFVLPVADHPRVAEDVARALEASGLFIRASEAPASPDGPGER
jgi:hypothetical protein